MVTLTPLFSFSSLLMASLFALSASLQFNDPVPFSQLSINWYFWLPLYATACVVNLVNGVFMFKISQQIPKCALWIGVVLFTKVVLEDVVHEIAGFWSLDMRERVVREKFGSGLVVICMFLQLGASSIPNPPKMEKNVEIANYVQYGMAILVGISYGLSLVFFLFQEREMKF